MKEVVIVSAKRTPVGSFGGVFKNTTPVELGKIAVQGALDEINLDYGIVDEVILGNVLGAGQGQNVARQVAIQAGLLQSVPALTINKVCGSGLKSIVLGAQSILTGDNEVVVAGGTENMSMAPYVLPGARWGQRMGDGKLVDTMLKDGLTDAFTDIHMGITAENIAEQFNITREDQDQLAAESQNKAEAATKAVEWTFKRNSKKAPYGVAKVAQKYKKPVFACAGYIGEDVEVLYDEGMTAIFGILDQAGSLEAALENGEQNLERTCENIVRTLAFAEKLA